LVTGFWQLVVVRVLFGIGEGPMGTTTNKSIANWFPKKRLAVRLVLPMQGSH
jgi:MFS family permease